MEKMRVILALIILVAAASSAATSGESNEKDEQRGRFYLFKVKPRSARDVSVLLRTDEAYGNHPPIFLQGVRAGDSALVIVEVSKANVLEKILQSNNIKFSKKGLTLVDSVATHASSAGETRSTSPAITLFDAVNFKGREVKMPINPGCNWVPSGWNDKTKSIKLNSECVKLYEHYYCKGRTVQVSPLNQELLADLANFQLNGVLSAVSSCDPLTCTAEGFFLVPGNCNAYFRCVDVQGTLVRYDFTCPPGQFFDPPNTACNLPDRIEPPPVHCY